MVVGKKTGEVIEVNQRRRRFFQMIEKELDRAYEKHSAEPWSRHEFYAILLEEVDELWDDIKSDQPLSVALKELVQVAAMCFRYAETGEMGKVIDKPTLP
jgi:NTP pyrophosphatase (non-canonical NTP hydrolase)